ncbi:hypothetical protein NPX13_g4066 [Xylaria arbuscula]|uniref:Uncharacterized protein n=1 Tax=Xylaria arbuscula TaxID=114810 RepID=A0A9W8NH31_9PEZI|nr:hypothetical protein NPX13_g4066 [Xylaria arbuscula]
MTIPIVTIPINISGYYVSPSTINDTTNSSIPSWCNNSTENNGCVGKKRDILPTAVPKMQIPRQPVDLCNVPQVNFDQCHGQLAGVTVTSSFPTPGEARFDGVPPACMDLAVVLAGACAGRKEPIVATCGSDCLHFTDLTDEELEALSKALSTTA